MFLTEDEAEMVGLIRIPRGHRVKRPSRYLTDDEARLVFSLSHELQKHINYGIGHDSRGYWLILDEIEALRLHVPNPR